MTIYHINNNWYDESTEGPYTEILQTKYDWSTKLYYKVVKGLGNMPIELFVNNRKIIGIFKTSAEAREAAEKHLLNNKSVGT